MTPLLPSLSPRVQRRVHAWLCLAVASLVGAGLFAGLVAMARTPWVQELLPGGEYLHGALVAHVVLSVVVWFLAFQGSLWALAEGGQRAHGISGRLAWAGFWAAVLGTAVLMIPAFLGWGHPVLANYVPVLTHPAFLAGLFLFGTGMGLAAFHALRVHLRAPRPLSFWSSGAAVSAGLVLVALVCFGLAALRVPPGTPSWMAAEHLAWGGGHVLQFASTAAMAWVWLILARWTLDEPVLRDPWAKAVLAFYLVFALPAPLLYLGDASTAREGFTLLMAMGLGPGTGILALAVILALHRRWRSPEGLPWGDPGFAGLVLSLAVFGLGGILALGIRGSNVVVPAHYHGVIGGVTLAFMGLSYHLLPRLGRNVWRQGLARVQPYLYGSGQALFVLGLFWAGLHGVPRKTFGAAQGLHQADQVVGMVLMGLGGLVAILGGIAFILNLVPSLLRRAASEPALAPAWWRRAEEGEA